MKLDTKQEGQISNISRIKHWHLIWKKKTKKERRKEKKELQIPYYVKVRAEVLHNTGEIAE